MSLRVLLAICLGLVAAESFAGTIVGSKHDMSYQGTLAQVCVYCHTPHNADSAAPLWNRFFSGDGSAFKLYSAVNSANLTFKSGLTSDSISLLCMSCHDGSTSTDDVINNGAPTSMNAITGSANFGTNLSNSHPINFQVSETDYQHDLWVSGASFTGAYMGRNNGFNAVAGAYNKKFPLFELAGSRVGPRSLECPTCHSVHDSEFSPFLRETMGGSKLCLGCHNK